RLARADQGQRRSNDDCEVVHWSFLYVVVPGPESVASDFGWFANSGGCGVLNDCFRQNPSSRSGRSAFYALPRWVGRGRMAAMEPIEPSSPDVKRSASVSIVAFRECDPSIIYGIYDTLWTAGSHWKSNSNAPVSKVLFTPRIIAA